jgi:hypothetical protein
VTASRIENMGDFELRPTDVLKLLREQDRVDLNRELPTASAGTLDHG